MSNNSQKLQYIVELLTQGDTTKAVSELKKLDAASMAVGKGLTSLGTNAKQLFAVLGGSAFANAALEKFLEQERAVNALNSALKQTGQLLPGVSEEVQELADAMGGELKKEADDVLKVMTQLITFGAKQQDLKRLTEAVFDLSEVMGRDVTRAARGMSLALNGNMEVFSQLGIEIDKTLKPTKQFNQGFEAMVQLVNGRAKDALKGVGGEVAALKLHLEELKETIGSWEALAISAVANVGQNLGKLLDRPQQETAITTLRDQYIALANAIAKAILEAERLGKITKEEAGKMFGRLGGAREILHGGSTGFGQTTSDEEIEAILSQRLPQAGGLLRGLQSRLGMTVPQAAPAVTGGKAAIGGTGLDLADKLAEEKAFTEQIAKLRENIAKSTEDQSKSQDKLSANLQRDAEETIRNFLDGQRVIRDLEEQTVMVGLEGNARIREQLAQDHRARVQQIKETQFATKAQYEEALALEQQLTDATSARFEESLTFMGRINNDIKDLAGQAMQLFSSGLAGAIVDAFEEGDEAFKKFAANFMKAIAEMILQAIIFRTLQSAFGFGSGSVGAAEGGQFSGTKMAMGGIAEVTRPTVFPNFNVMAGEAGREVMTVLSRPSRQSFGGLEAQVGMAGGHRLAITSADGLAGAMGRGGMAVIRVELQPGLKAEIVENSVKGAELRVIEKLGTNSEISRGVRKLTA